MGIICPGGFFAYGSLYNPSDDPINVMNGEKVSFTEAGSALLGVVPDLQNNELVVSTSGIYEITMDVIIRVTFSSGIIIPGQNTVAFLLFVNENSVARSHFEVRTSVLDTFPLGQALILETVHTIGKTIQLDLSANDRLSVRISSAGFFFQVTPAYWQPSLIVKKIAE